jgi:DNA-binding transcriptional ArsR family regulator
MISKELFKMITDDAVVNLFALAHPGRMQVFRTIVQGGDAGVAAGAIAKTLGIPANTTSTHLSILTGAGLLSAYRDGRSIIYRVNYSHFSELLTYMVTDCAMSHPDIVRSLRDLV